MNETKMEEMKQKASQVADTTELENLKQQLAEARGMSAEVTSLKKKLEDAKSENHHLEDVMQLLEQNFFNFCKHKAFIQ